MLERYLNFILLIIQDHFVIFTGITLSFILIMSLLYLKKRKSVPVSPVTTHHLDTTKKAPLIITSQDIKAIAGDDIMTTQLDLARAYIEIGKTKLAKKILDHVTQHGNISQQQIAQHLMTNL